MIRSVICRFHVMSIRYVGEYGSRSNRNKNVLAEVAKVAEVLQCVYFFHDKALPCDED